MKLSKCQNYCFRNDTSKNDLHRLSSTVNYFGSNHGPNTMSVYEGGGEMFPKFYNAMDIQQLSHTTVATAFHFIPTSCKRTNSAPIKVPSPHTGS